MILIILFIYVNINFLLTFFSMYFMEILLFVNVCTAFAVQQISIKYFNISTIQTEDVIGNYTTFQLVSLFILLPLIEESIFRHTLVEFTRDLSYYVELNVVLFSSMHLTNYYVTKSKILSINQAVSLIYPGYYFVKLGNVKHSMIAHFLYNLSGSIIIFTYSYFTKKDNKLELISTIPVKFKRSKSTTNIPDSYCDTYYLPNNIKKSIENYNRVTRNMYITTGILKRTSSTGNITDYKKKYVHTLIHNIRKDNRDSFVLLSKYIRKTEKKDIHLYL